MLEHYLNQDTNKLIIFIDRKSKPELIRLFQLIDNSIITKKYFIVIHGLDLTIDRFADTCISKDFRLYKNGKYNRLIENLPTLYMLSSQWNDVLTFIDYFGNFNEGWMYLSFVDSAFSPVFIDENDHEVILEKSHDHSIVEIDCENESALEIKPVSPDFPLEKIMTWLATQS